MKDKPAVKAAKAMRAIRNDKEVSFQTTEVIPVENWKEMTRMMNHPICGPSKGTRYIEVGYPNTMVATGTKLDPAPRSGSCRVQGVRLSSITPVKAANHSTQCQIDGKRTPTTSPQGKVSRDPEVIPQEALRHDIALRVASCLNMGDVRGREPPD